MTDIQTQATSTNLSMLTDLLTRCVQIAVGSDTAQPRPGQLMLSRDIWQAIESKGRVGGIAPTGVGKSYAHMTAAALAARVLNERTVISTDSLALQSQFVQKDLPVVAQAMREMLGFELDYAVLKGVSNYIDPVRTLELARGLTGEPKQGSFSDLLKMLRDGKYERGWKPEHRGEYSPNAQLSKLAQWALEQYLDLGAQGDRDSCSVEHTNDDWQLVSASSEEKADEDDTGFLPKADFAKELAGAAHIVITNHVLLGMQAARGIPTVLGSRKLGRFHNIIVDEAHTLPSQVRTRGASELSERAIMRTVRAVERVIEGSWVREDGQQVAQKLERALHEELKQLPPREEALRIPADSQGPVAEVYEELDGLIGSLLMSVKDGLKISEDVQFKQKSRRAIGALEQLSASLEALTTPTEQIARWVTPGMDKFGPKAESSPVDVSGLIFNRLWNIDPGDDLTAEEIAQLESLDDEDEEKLKVPLGVACVSATLPVGYYVQVALPAPAPEYPSPYGDAYLGSAMYIPKCLDPQDIDALKRDNSYGGKLQFDTYRHEMWCIDKIVDLVRANGGSALVLSAKASSGKKYAEALRRKLPGIHVHSQWDGGQVSRIVSEWREDVGSVLVGTRSLMTGVDAPGETCSLIVIDRPPRAAKNVIDEARVDLHVANGMDRWTADRLVYVADAQMLLEQSVGRLIRGVNDRGLVTVLDPRLLTSEYSAFNYQTQTRQMFVRPLLSFGNKFNMLDDACQWLRDRQAARA